MIHTYYLATSPTQQVPSTLGARQHTSQHLLCTDHAATPIRLHSLVTPAILQVPNTFGRDSARRSTSENQDEGAPALPSPSGMSAARR